MRELKINAAIVLSLLILLKPVYAVDLPEDLQQKLRDHPSVSKFNASISAYEFESDGATGLPNPKIEFGINNLPIEDPAFDRYLPTNKSITFSQNIPSHRKRNSVSKKQLTLAGLFRLKEQDRVAELRHKAISLLANLAKIDRLTSLIYHQNLRFDELDTWLKGELESGENVYARFAELDAQRSELQLLQNELDEEKSRIESELIYLFEEVPSYRPGDTRPTTWNGDLNSLLPVLLAQKAVAVASSEVEIMDADLDNGYNFAITYQQREEGDSFDGEDWVTLKFGMSVPLWGEKSQIPRKKAAQKQLISQKHEFDDQIRVARKTLMRAQSDLEILYKRQDLLLQQLKSLDQQHDSLERRYESGEIELESLIRLKISKIKVSMQRVRVDSKIIETSSLIERQFIGEPL